MDCLIDDVLPKNRVHLLGGVSDAGKTRWVIPALLQWEQGLPVLGRNSHPVPWVYVAGDRDVIEVHDSLYTMGLPPTCIRIFPAFGAHRKHWKDIIEALSKWEPRPELIVWEGFSDLPDGDQRREVREFLSSITPYCHVTQQFPNGLTILGVVESPKQKPYEKYPNPRHRVSGASAWSYHTSTVMLVEAAKGDEALETINRTFWVCTKNCGRRSLPAYFDAQGRLIVL
jgi:hypothetical protein